MRSLRVRTAESVRFSHGRKDALLFLRVCKRATAAEIAKALCIPRYRAYAILFGDWPEYAPEYALVPAGVVRAVRSAFGEEFELTPEGEFEAETLARALVEHRVL